MAISAKDVMELRRQTDCGMMECKKALTQADGDFAKAVEILREQGPGHRFQEGRPHRRRGHGLRCRLRQLRRRRRGQCRDRLCCQERQVR